MELNSSCRAASPNYLSQSLDPTPTHYPEFEDQRFGKKEVLVSVNQ